MDDLEGDKNKHNLGHDTVPASQSINAIPAAAPNALEPMTASCKSVIKRIVLMGGATIFLLFGLITAFLSYLCTAHSCSVVKHSLVSTAALRKVLTLLHVASHVSTLLLPVTMKVFSYQLAGWWLKDSEHVTQDGLPSLLQYIQSFNTTTRLTFWSGSVSYSLFVEMQTLLPSSPHWFMSIMHVNGKCCLQ